MNSGWIGRSVAGFLALVLTLPVALPAQETIFDPANPGNAEEETDDESEDSGEDDNGEDRDSEGDRSSPSLIDDPERPRRDSQDAPPESSEALRFQDTRIGLEAGLTTAVAPRLVAGTQDRLQIQGAMAMHIDHELSPRTSAVIRGRFHYWAGSGRGLDNWRTLYEPRLERAYLVHRPGRWAFALGQMRNSWGSTNIIRPGDVIDPVDLRDPGGGAGFGSALGQLSATATYSARNWTLRALVVPFFQPNQVSLFGRDTSLANDANPLVAEQLPFLLLAEQFITPGAQEYAQPFLMSLGRPRDLPKNASGGLRATTTLGSTDLGLGLFYGWDRTPWVELDEDLRFILNQIAEDGQLFEDYDFIGFAQRNPEVVGRGNELSEKAEAGETIFDSSFRRRATLVADAARYVGPIGVRADVAFSPRQVFYTTDFTPQQRASLFSALGLSFERLLDGQRPLALTLEGFWLHPFAQDSAIHRALIPATPGEDQGQELLIFDGGYYGLAGAVNWHSPWWELVLEAGGLTSFPAADIVGQVAIKRRWQNGLRAAIGANFFAGPDPADRLSAGGLWNHNDRVQLTLGGDF